MREFNNSLWFMPLTVMAAPAFATDYLSVAQAQKILFGDSSVFVERPLHLSKEQIRDIKRLSGTRQRQDTQPVWRVQARDGEPVGWFMVDDVIGKHEYITYALGIDNDGAIIGLEILSYREAHGGEVREASWRNNFKHKTLADPFKLGDDVPNLSGATLSCRNLVEGAKRLLVIYNTMLRAK